MKVSLEVDIVPFIVPQCLYVSQKARNRGEGMGQSQAIAFADVSADDLAKMCDAFKQEVMKRHDFERATLIRNEDPTGY